MLIMRQNFLNTVFFFQCRMVKQTLSSVTNAISWLQVSEGSTSIEITSQE